MKGKRYGDKGRNGRKSKGNVKKRREIKFMEKSKEKTKGEGEEK